MRAEASRQFARGKNEWRWGGFFAWFFLAFGSGVAIIVLSILFLDWNTMRGPVSRFVSARIGRPVRIEGDMKVHLFSFTPSLSADAIHVANPAWQGPGEMASAGRFTIQVRLIPLLFGQAIFPLIKVERPDVVLFRDGLGRANWVFRGQSDSGDMSLPPINRLEIDDGKVTLYDKAHHMTFAGTFASHEETNGSRTDRFVLDGKGTLRGAPLSASVRGGALLHVDPAKPYAVSVDVRHGATHIVANGALERPFDLNHLTASATASGPTLADLYFLSGLAMPNTSPYRLSATFIRDGHFYRLAKMGGVVGNSDLFGEMSVDTSSGRPFLKANLESKSLAFRDLGPLIGSSPGGATLRTKTAGGATTVLVTSSRVLPDMPLRVERVRGMDALVDYRADAIRSQDFPLRQVILHLSLDRGVMLFNPLSFSFPQGKLTSKVKIDARGAIPVNDVDARLTGLHLGQFFGGAHPVVEGIVAARAKLHAAGDSIHKAAAAANGTLTVVVPSGAVRRSYAELSGINITPGLFELLGHDTADTNLRCGVMHFEARNGSLVAQQLVIDTDAMQIRGQGTLNLDTEQMQFQLQGDSKSFKLIRVRAPIVIGGTLAEPHVGVKAGAAVAQGGLAVALGVFLSPLAAILPFVDPGLAKDANCSALLSTAKAQGASVKSEPAAAHRFRRSRHHPVAVR